VSEQIPLEIRVSVDVGSHSHNVAIGLSSGEVLEEFQISHGPEGFRHFFSCIERQQKKRGCPVAVAMEGYNGYARPLDGMVRARGYRLYNINNLKLARFKEIFPGAAKTDPIDARKGLELFQLRDHLPLAKEVLQEVAAVPHENEVLKRLSRRRRRLVNERGRVLNNLQGDLQAVCPGLLDNSSGKHQGSKRPRQVNTRAKAAMMTALDRHRKYVAESQRYYEKKRAQGKRHNQAIRALGRHLSRIIYKMLKEEREYQVRSAKGGTQAKVRSRSSLKRQIRRPKITANS